VWWGRKRIEGWAVVAHLGEGRRWWHVVVMKSIVLGYALVS